MATPASNDPDRDSLLSAGVSLDGHVDDPDGEKQVGAGQVSWQAFRDNSLTPAQAATHLRCDLARVHELLAEGDLLAYTCRDPATENEDTLLPSWQFTGREPLPGLRSLATPAAGLHPLIVAGFMHTPDPDLDLDQNGRAVSPLEWLTAGGEPSVVAGLLHSLRAGR